MRPVSSPESPGRAFSAAPGSFRFLAEAALDRVRDGLFLLSPAANTVPAHDIALRITPEGWRIGDEGDSDETRLRDILVKSGGRILLEWDESLALCDRINLPAMPRRDIAQIAQNRIAYLSPFPAERTLGLIALAKAPGDLYRTDLAVLDADRVEPVLALAVESGCTVTGIAIMAGNTRLFSAIPDWIAAPAQQARLAFWHKAHPVMRSSAIAMAMVAAVFSVCLATAGFRADQLRLEAGAASEALAEATRNAEQAAALETLRASSSHLLGGLEAFSAKLPDDAYVELLRFEGGTLSITAYAPSADAVRAILAGLPGVTSAALDGAITRDSSGKIERFILTGTIGAAATP
jgi:hypothetical protein